MQHATTLKVRGVVAVVVLVVAVVTNTSTTNAIMIGDQHQGRECEGLRMALWITSGDV